MNSNTQDLKKKEEPKNKDAMRKEKFMKTKGRIAKSRIAAVMFLVLLLTTLPGMKLYAAPDEGAGVLATSEEKELEELRAIEEDENFTNDEALLEEEKRLDEEAAKNGGMTLSEEDGEATSQIVTFAASGATIRYHFIDTTGSGGGDATLVEVADRTYLIDGGPARGYPRLKQYLSSHCKKKNGKIEIHVAVVTHNHTDHYEGVRSVLNDTATFRVRKVLKSSIKPNSALNAACNKSEKDNGTIVRTLKVGEIVKLAAHQGSQITVYGPSNSYDNVGGGESTRMNNLSMVVKVNSVKKLIIMGDLYYAGFKRAETKYGTELFSGDYTFCKVGHHGIRNGGKHGNDDKSIQTLKAEINLYKEHINAKRYIFTSATDTKNNETYKNNYIRFKEGLGASKVLETSVSGNICASCTASNFTVSKERG